MQTISDISAIVTCFLFVLYIIGHIWKIFITKHTKFEKFEIQKFSGLDECNEMEDYDKVLMVDDIGEVFSLSSSYGIRSIKVYEVSYEFENDNNLKLKSKKLKSTYPNLDIDETLYIRCDLGEIMPKIQFEIERTDYTKVLFALTMSGKTGNILAFDYSFRMTLKSFFYYLCV